MNNEVLFTPAALLDLLTQIEELSNVDVGITESIDGSLNLAVGESTYIIDNHAATNIEVDSDVVDAVNTANIEAYEDLADTGQVSLSEPIQSGVIKEIAKTLLVGGLVRLSAKLLK